jgi:hypothetical protein
MQNREIESTIRETGNFNYGATDSIREEASVTDCAQYFQNLDILMYYNMTIRQILDSLREFLKKNNLDTSDLEESSNAIYNAIYNSGVIFSGNSSFSIDNLANGYQAQAIKNNPAPSTPPGETPAPPKPPEKKA